MEMHIRWGQTYGMVGSNENGMVGSDRPENEASLEYAFFFNY